MRLDELRRRDDVEDDKINHGAIPKAAIKCLKAGEYTSLCNFWDKPVAAKRAHGLNVALLALANDVKNFEWCDWIQAMLKLAMGYIDNGQGHIGRQVINLLHGAMILSASWQRKSIQDACEAVRRASTSTNEKVCSWSAQSLYGAHAHVLLEPLPKRSFFSSRRPLRKRQFPSRGLDFSRFVPDKSGDSIGSKTDSGRQVSASGGASKKVKEGPVGVCRYWLRGQDCFHNPCRFSHSCTACGQVKVHDPSSCPLLAVSRRST